MRRLEIAVNLLLVFGPVAIGIAVLVLLSPSLTILASLACFVIGMALLVYAKCSLFKRGIWVSFGTSRMDTTARKAYWQAYGFIVVGVAMNLVSQLTLFGAR